MKTFKQFVAEEIGAAQAPPAIVQPAPKKKDEIGDLIDRLNKQKKSVEKAEQGKPQEKGDLSAFIKKKVTPHDYLEGFLDRTIRYEGPSGKITHDTGGMTKYGISQRAYPHLDIANLTKDQAIDLYKKDYYGRMPLHHFSHKSRAIIHDAAVNQGQTWTERMVKEVGDNPEELLKARAKRYHQTATGKNAETHSQYHQSWKNRLERLKKDIEDLD